MAKKIKNSKTGTPFNDKRVMDSKRIIKDYVVRKLKSNKDLHKITYKEIAEATGLSETTVRMHYKKIEFKPLESPLRELTPYVILNIYNNSKRSAASQKLWMQIMEGWNEEYTINQLLQNAEKKDIHEPKSAREVELIQELFDEIKENEDSSNIAEPDGAEAD